MRGRADVIGDILVALDDSDDDVACWATFVEHIREFTRADSVCAYSSWRGCTPVRAASTGPELTPHVTDPADTLSSQCGEMRAWLLTWPELDDDLGRPVRALLSAATATASALRLQHLRRQHVELHEHLVREETHALRQSLSTLSGIGTGALSGAVEPPVDPYIEAIDEAARDSDRRLKRFGWTVHAARGEHTSAHAISELVDTAHFSHHARHPAPSLHQPAGTTPALNVPGTVAEWVFTELLDAVYPLSPHVPCLAVTPHPDGWAIEIEQHTAAGTQATWQQVGRVDLRPVALCINLLGGRLWSQAPRAGDEVVVRLGFTLPAAS